MSTEYFQTVSGRRKFSIERSGGLFEDVYWLKDDTSQKVLTTFSINWLNPRGRRSFEIGDSTYTIQWIAGGARFHARSIAILYNDRLIAYTGDESAQNLKSLNINTGYTSFMLNMVSIVVVAGIMSFFRHSTGAEKVPLVLLFVGGISAALMGIGFLADFVTTMSFKD